MVNPSPTNQDPLPPKRSDDHILEYCKTHSREIIAYVVLILGIIMLFFDPLYGGALVGLIAGIYFGDAVLPYILNWKANVDEHGIPKHLIAGGILVAFFISAPAIFLGIAVAIAIKQLFTDSSNRT